MSEEGVEAGRAPFIGSERGWVGGELVGELEIKKIKKKKKKEKKTILNIIKEKKSFF